MFKLLTELIVGEIWIAAAPEYPTSLFSSGRATVKPETAASEMFASLLFVWGYKKARKTNQ